MNKNLNINLVSVQKDLICMSIYLYVNLLKILPCIGSLNISCTIQLKNSQHWTFWEILLFAGLILDSYCLWCPHAMFSFNFLVFSQSSNFKFVIRLRKGHHLWIIPLFIYTPHMPCLFLKYVLFWFRERRVRNQSINILKVFLEF